MKSWEGCKNLLVIRADNMGDLLLSSPAIRALKQHFSCKITVLTSSKAQSVVPLLPFIDEVMVADLPWVKLDEQDVGVDFLTLVNNLKARAFDGCVLFTVYSQNPMPAILLSYLAAIPRRLAYCRENPYHLLTNWVPDLEPYQLIKHQVRRDLDLVATLGVNTADQDLSVEIPVSAFNRADAQLEKFGPELIQDGYIILHPGVSELKRRFPKERWINLAKKLLQMEEVPLLITGSAAEIEIAQEIATAAGKGCFSGAGYFSLPEFAVVIKKAKAVISVNTGTVHLAAAVNTPIVVLYAQTNPQHHPWSVSNVVLPFSIPKEMKSRNEVLHWVDQMYYAAPIPFPETAAIVAALKTIT